ncbi:MAG: hypothetical protein IJH37_07185 [Clostridia bacterium]|nr:hypothetical protein [Clostridia bacterium]
MKRYFKPEIEIMAFCQEEIMTASGQTTDAVEAWDAANTNSAKRVDWNGLDGVNVVF